MLEQLPPYAELKELEEGLNQQKMLTFQNIFQEPTGYYMIKCFLIADYAGAHRPPAFDLSSFRFD
jgi:hypothetical protein